jgi:uncharacterized membrane protein (DUF4010 family)
MLGNEAAVEGVAVALGCGLLIGIDRERRKGHGPARGFAGVRSFALAALAGAMAQALGAGMVAVAGLLLTLLIAIAYARHRTDDPGVTTELALFVSFLLGVAAIGQPALAAGGAVVVAALLNLRSPLHHFARVSLRKNEVRDALIFAAAALVVRPLLPDAGSRWLLGVNPRALWTLVLLIMGIQAAAHVGLRIAGSRFGLALSGLAAGFVSGVATITAMGVRCRQDPPMRAACVAGALLSNVATFALLWVVAATVAPAYLWQLAPVLASGTAAAVAVGLLAMAMQRDGAPPARHARRVFEIRQALAFAVLLTVASSALAYLNAWAGPGALLGGAALAGFFDVHATVASALVLLAGGQAMANDAVLALLLAVSTNMVSKAAGALAGGWQYALRVQASLALVLLAAWLPFWLGLAAQ